MVDVFGKVTRDVLMSNKCKGDMKEFRTPTWKTKMLHNYGSKKLNSMHMIYGCFSCK